MDFENLKHAARLRDHSTTPTPAEMLATVKARSAAFERATRQRTAIGAAMFLLPVPFGALLLEIQPDGAPAVSIAMWSVLALLVIAAGLVIRNGVLQLQQPGRAGDSLRDHLTTQLARVARQAWLFQSLKWWFWAPLALGWAVYLGALLTGSIAQSPIAMLNLFVFPALAYAGIRHSQRYLEREILPWQREFERSLAVLGEKGSNSI